jgi:hypothetical protein
LYVNIIYYTHLYSQFDLPESVGGECSDYVAVYSGTVPTKNKLIGKFCGSAMPSNLFVNELSVYIQFVSDGDGVTSSGFKMTFSTSSSMSCKF